MLHTPATGVRFYNKGALLKQFLLLMGISFTLVFIAYYVDEERERAYTQEILEIAEESAFGPAGKPVFKLPETAEKINENIYHLGTVNYRSEELTGYAILRKRETLTGRVSPFRRDRSLPVWKRPEGYHINPENLQGISSEGVVNSFSKAIEEYQQFSSYPVIKKNSVRITQKRLEADWDRPDDINEVYFGEIAGNDIAAITVVWGVFDRNNHPQKLISWDQIYDESSFAWTLQEGCSVDDSHAVQFDSIVFQELQYALGVAPLEDLMFPQTPVNEEKRAEDEIQVAVIE